MKARLISKWGETEGARFDISREATVGRSRGNTIVLPTKSVSTDHARIGWDENRECFFLEDLGSLNGTELDGVPVERRERLGRLHIINFGGDSRFIFMALDGDPAPTGTVVDGEVTGLPAGLGDKAAGDGAPAAARTMSDADEVVLPESLAREAGRESDGDRES